ncbi:MAG TPA: hypothetical protein VFJ72_13875 [Rubrobacteraceae bacterium]|nr:hypothetical protein [Rubrobacteraceae bacterium]
MSRKKYAGFEETTALLEEHLPERPYVRFTDLRRNGRLVFSQLWAGFEGTEECATAGWRVRIPINPARVRRDPQGSAEFIIRKVDDAARNAGVFYWEI